MFHVKPTCPFHFITFTKTKWLTRRRSSVSVRTWNMTLCSCTSSCVSGGSPRLVPTSSPSCKAGIVWSACTSLSSFIRDDFVNADRVDWRGSLSVLTNCKRFAVNVAPNCDLTQQFQAREFVEASGTNADHEKAVRRPRDAPLVQALCETATSWRAGELAMASVRSPYSS